MAEMGQGSRTGPKPAPVPASVLAPCPYSPALKELLRNLEQQSLVNLEQCTDRLVQQIYQGAEGIRQKIRQTGVEEGSTGTSAANGCFQCGQQGHYKRECPLRQKVTPAVPATPVVPSVVLRKKKK